MKWWRERASPALQLNKFLRMIISMSAGNNNESEKETGKGRWKNKEGEERRERKEKENSWKGVYGTSYEQSITRDTCCGLLIDKFNVKETNQDLRLFKRESQYFLDRIDLL